jgi:Resolvase, N terminal domain
MMKMAAIYARVSSEQQREENTIASQTASLIEFAKSHDLEVPAEWVFEDEGYSGATAGATLGGGILAHVDFSAMAVKCPFHFLFVYILLRSVLSPARSELDIRAGSTDPFNWYVSQPFGHFQGWLFHPSR